MSVLNNQRFFQGGSVFHVARYNSSNVLQAWRDWGTVKVISPNVAPTIITQKDSRSGFLQIVEQRTTEFNESFEIETPNMSLENLSMYFGADSVEAYSQSSTPLTNIAHTLVAVDSIIPLINGSGDRVYNVASVEQVSVGTTNYTAGTDYIASSTMLKLGYIHIPAGSTIPAGSIDIDFTPTAISSSKRLFKPQKAAVIKARGEVFWIQENYADILARDMFDCFITATAAEMLDDNYSKLRCKIDVIGDPTNSTTPAGRLVHPIGSVPTKAVV